MRHLLRDWESVQPRIQGAKNLFLFLDYDGTLTPIVSRPEQALCPPEVKKQLEQLRDLSGVFPVVISGRSLEDVREKVGVSGIYYVGNHGLEITDPNGRQKKNVSRARIRDLIKIIQNVKESLKGLPGILFEEKGPILSVHYRNVPQASWASIRKNLEEELRRWRGRWRMASGKMVFEIRPNIDFNKGKAVRDILKNFRHQDVFPICLGDDRTDEDAFQAVKGQGISVFIGPAGFPSGADYYLRHPGEVYRFLSRCHRARRPGRELPGDP